MLLSCCSWLCCSVAVAGFVVVVVVVVVIVIVIVIVVVVVIVIVVIVIVVFKGNISAKLQPLELVLFRLVLLDNIIKMSII